MANSLVIARTAPLDAVYASCAVALPTRATTEAVFITDAFVFLCLRNDKIACLHPYQTPFTYDLLESILYLEWMLGPIYVNIMGFIPDFVGSFDSIVVLLG